MRQLEEEVEEPESEYSCRPFACCRIPAFTEELLPTRNEADVWFVALTEGYVNFVVACEIAYNQLATPISGVRTQAGVMLKLKAESKFAQ